MKSASEAKIAIWGAGAMGTVLGALLTKGGLKNVDFITRNTAHLQGLKDRGARIVCEAEKTEFSVPVHALHPTEVTEVYDIVFLMTKQRENAKTLQTVLPHLAADGLVCTTQNGLPERSVAEIVGAERTYGAVTSYGATFLGDGAVSLTSKFDGMTMEVGGYENDGKGLPLLVEILSCAGNAVDNGSFVNVSDNLLGARWSKLAINAAFSGLSVMTGLTFGELAKKRKSRKIALGILRECIDVAEGLGVRIAPMQGHDMRKLLGGRTPPKRLFAYLVLPYAMRKHQKLRSGMLKDLLGGRKCEVDFINGLVCEEGKRANVETPLCATVVEIVHGIENGLYELSYRNVDFFVR
ncbi:MAG: 2-dehydropantoate 2-reductase [Clostridia bacterium]|nr:2-dehydropantoate 2-reductase [Clostridia bacterium]